MRKLTYAAFAVLLLTTSALAQNAPQTVQDKFRTQPIAKPVLREDKGLWRPYGPMTKASLAVCVAGGLADTFSTGNLYEQNPLLRRSDGSINKPLAIVTTVGLCGGSLLFEKRHAKLVSAFRYIAGAIRFGMAVHNWAQR